MARMRVSLGGTPVDLMSGEDAIGIIMESALGRRPPLAVASANLDHIFHFGPGGRWQGILDESRGLRWLTLLDGHPLVNRSRRLTGRSWPRLAGSDLIGDLLSAAEANGAIVGFFGGRSKTHQRLASELRRGWPGLNVGGYWAPDRSELADHARSRELAAEARSAGVQLLFVGLGKPRQEAWIAEHGIASGAGALLGFGAAADFLSGAAVRAPEQVRRMGMEWLWRLAHDPKRLSRRYLIEAPGAYVQLLLHSSLAAGTQLNGTEGSPCDLTARVPSGIGSLPDAVTVVIVTYNSEEQIGPLLADLSSQASGPPLRVLVVDNCSSDLTRAVVQRAGAAELVEAPSNLGYAGAVNFGVRYARPPGALLVLNPDIRLGPVAVAELWDRMQAEKAGAVVPLIVDERGEVYPSLRFEPTLLRDLGDAVLGSHLSSRPPWTTETDFDPESYQFPHRVDWATGAAVLISAEAMRRVGPWNEDFFLYSEETDFLRRVRDTGLTVWFEPQARVVHVGAASGSSPDLDALRAVNRVRYAELHHRRAYSTAARAVVALSSLVRAHQTAGHRRALRFVLRRQRWSELPAARAESSKSGTDAGVA